MHLVDTHAHLFWDSFKADFDQIIQKAIDAKLAYIINVGVDIEKSQLAVELEPNNPQVKFYSSIGIHPHEAYKYRDNQKLAEDINALRKIYQENSSKVIGVGECGLDYLINPTYNPDNLTNEQLKQLQIKLLQAQVELAKELNLPLLIHCRDDRSKNPNNTECWDEILRLTHNWKGIYHCYSGLPQTTTTLLQNTKFYLSFAGNLTYPKNDYLKAAVKIIPLERIVLETDCPFLPPQSIRGKRNEPSSVKEIAQTIAEIKDININEVGQTTTDNFLRLFNLQT